MKRIEKIMSILDLESRVDITELAKKFGVSEITIRRDMEMLENQGVVTRTLRGATINRENIFKIPYLERMKKNIQEKRAIARKALSYISPADTIVICNGTTTYQLAKILRNAKMELRVFTNALDSAIELAYSDYITTIVAGGQVTESYTIEILGDSKISNQIGTIDKMFIGGDGVDLEHGLTSFSTLDVEANHIMMKGVREIIVLIDHNKFDVIRYGKLLPLECINVLVTDDGLSDSIAQKYKERGVNLVLAETSKISVR